MLLVATNPAAFRAKYSVPVEVQIFGPIGGTLQDSGERLRLERPAPPDTNGPAYIIVDEVRYNDRAPWSAAADGSGPSLQRKDAALYGNDPINWDSAVPTPGRANTTRDSDGDGMPDVWEQAYGTQPGVPDANADPDNDGRSNIEEYLAGTHPNNPSSRLLITIDANSRIRFNSIVGRLYSLQYSSNLPPAWSDVLPATNGTGLPILVTRTNQTGGGFYRLRVEKR